MALGFLEKLHAAGVPVAYVAPTQDMARERRRRTGVPCLWLAALHGDAGVDRRAIVVDDCERMTPDAAELVVRVWRALSTNFGPTQLVLVNWPGEFPPVDGAVPSKRYDENCHIVPPPIDMVLHCPACGLQHIDKPKACDMGVGCGEVGPCYAAAHGEPDRCPVWTNPPHRSHLCAGCGHTWRPADVPTNGVQAVKTQGKMDSPLHPGGK